MVQRRGQRRGGLRGGLTEGRKLQKGLGEWGEAPGHWGIPSEGPAAFLEGFQEAWPAFPWEGPSHSPPPCLEEWTP